MNRTSTVILRYLLSDFRERALDAEALRSGYQGFSLATLKQRCTQEQRISAVDYDLAIDDLEETELISTGPMDVYENPPGATVIAIGVFSRREFACLTEKGYRMIGGDDDFFFPHTVAVRTQSDGKWHEGIKAQVERDKITLLEGKLPITEGDQLRRTTANGVPEEYEIEHVEFQAADMDFPAMIVAHVQKRGSGLHARRQRIQQTNYNVAGANSRINVNSPDHSTNTVNVNSDAVFKELARAISQQVQDVTLRNQLTTSITEMERTKGTHDFTSHFQSFMALAANCMTVVMPFIPALTQMLK